MKKCSSEKINCRGTKSSIKTILRDLNFKYKNCNDGRRFLFEINYIITSRVKFLRKMYELRQNNDTRPVVYLDETWVNQNHMQGYINGKIQKTPRDLKYQLERALDSLYATLVHLQLDL